MKEDNAVLDFVCWSRTASRLAHVPEQGLKMVTTGRLTTYPGRSSYQFGIESLEPAGPGALMVANSWRPWAFLTQSARRRFPETEDSAPSTIRPVTP